MHNVNEIADYIILKMSEANGFPSILKLQKLLYYSQAWYLVNFGESLFDGKFQAWVHGPVNRTIYDRFSNRNMYLSLTPDDITSDFDINKLDTTIQSFLDDVLDVYGKYTGSQLEEMTHKEDPWVITRGNLPASCRCERDIDEKLIKDYYSKLVS